MKSLFLTVTLLTLSACSTTTTPVTTDPAAIDIVDICESKSVHEIGVADAMTDKKMNASFIGTCNKSKRLELRKSYRMGYKKGLAQKNHTKRSISGK